MVNPFKYTCLFGGGAIRGLAYVGAIRAMEELGIDFDIIGGSSVGSIFATLRACGYKSYELEKLFLKVNFELFRDIHFGFGRNIALSKGNIFEEWLEELTSAFEEDEAKKAEISNLANVLKAKLAKDESEALAAQHAAQVAQHKVQQEVQEAVFELPQEVEKTAPEVHQLLGLKLGSKSAEESANAFIELEKEAQFT